MDVQKVIFAYSLMLIIFVLCQLFTYDGFIRLLESFWLPGGATTARLLGSVIVVCELFALPFLLRMDLSRLMRIISMVLGWVVPAIWILLTLWINLTVNAISNVGFLGSVIKIQPGWWAVCMSVGLGLFAAWSSWGLWPFVAKKK
jgi:type III secretory pathway component EscU